MKSPIIAAAAAASLVNPLAPAVAGVNEDVKLCRAAIAASTEVEISGYNVNFKRTQGGRIRTLRFTLSPIARSGGSYEVRCTVEKGVVTDLRFLADN